MTARPGRALTGRAITVVAFALVAVAAVLLALAFRYPFVESRFALVLPGWIPDVMDLHERIRAWLIREGRIPVGEQSLTDVVRALSTDGEWFIAGAIVLFSFVFPTLKIGLAAIVLSLGRARTRARRALVGLLELTSKWSMADVFIVGVVIVFFKAEGFHFEIQPREGLYCFAASAIASATAVGLTGRLVRDDHHMERSLAATSTRAAMPSATRGSASDRLE